MSVFSIGDVMKTLVGTTQFQRLMALNHATYISSAIGEKI